jgi:16S rRNA (cytosine967-C5)-methyltransferase
MLVLDRIPDFAAVDAAVGAVRAQRGPRVAGFANAVLRKLGDAGEHLSLEQALRESVPSWLFERLCRVVGEAEALAVLGARDSGPTVAIRLVQGRELPGSLRDAAPGRLSPRARRLERQGDPHALEGYASGQFVVQEEGAQAVGLLLGARPGERVLDACAGRGQKASLLAEQVGASGRVVATDLHPKKLEALVREFERLGLPAPETHALDWTVGTAALPADFDRVLVDAPCSGTGTLRHRPEILERLGPDDPARLGQLAASILRAAATRTRPGGRVVFAVCSLLEEEAEAVVERVADVLTPCPFDAPELAPVLGEGSTSLRLLPLRHGSDGYFVASFLRRS